MSPLHRWDAVLLRDLDKVFSSEGVDTGLHLAPGFSESLAIPGTAEKKAGHDFPDRARWGVQGNNVLLEDLLFRPV